MRHTIASFLRPYKPTCPVFVTKNIESKTAWTVGRAENEACMVLETTGFKMMMGVNHCHGNRVSIQCAGSC